MLTDSRSYFLRRSKSSLAANTSESYLKAKRVGKRSFELLND